MSDTYIWKPDELKEKIVKRRISESLFVGAFVAVVGLVMLSGCKATEPLNDAPGSGVNNTKPADTVAMPDGFSNVATKCDHGNRIYVAFHNDNAYAAVAVVPQDPSCK